MSHLIAPWLLGFIVVSLGLSTLVACTTPESTASESEVGATNVPEPTAMPVGTHKLDSLPTAVNEVPTVTPELDITEDPSPADPAPAVQDEQLLAVQIDELIEGEQGTFSVVVVGPDGITVYRHEPDLQIEAASL